jgi:ABC-type glycerol-3-phosphate transport system substrate-binding protein
MSFDRRTVIKGAAAAAATLALPAHVGQAQTGKKISILTWNIPDQADLVNAWIKAFQEKHPGVEVEWLDKKGPELPTFYQTQLVAGTPPDIINTQGALWLEYAANGALQDLTPLIQNDPELKDRFNKDYLANWAYEGNNYMFPFYITKTLLFWNKILFKEAGLSGPPQTFDQVMEYASKIAGGEKTGLVTLNFDWLFWPLFAANRIDFLSPDLKRAVFNTPQAQELVTRLAKATESGAINKVSWTGRWVENNGAFAAGNVGMHHAHSPAFFFIRGQGKWVNPDTLGAGHFPGGWATPNSHGLGISKGSKNPELAFEFLKMITNDQWTKRFATERKVLTGNTKTDLAVLQEMKATDPLAEQVLRTQIEMTDKQVGNWPVATDSQLKEAFFPELQSAMLGRVSAKDALAEAERKVNRVLRRA